MMKLRYLFVLVVLLGLAASACSGNGGGAEPDGTLSTVGDAAAALEDQGLPVTRGEEVEQPFFSVPAVMLNTADSGIQVFEYADEAAAEADAELVAPDGSSVGTSMPFWVGDPHFFRSGNLIALYVGADEAILDTLEAVFGPQFAGR